MLQISLAYLVANHPCRPPALHPSSLPIPYLPLIHFADEKSSFYNSLSPKTRLMVGGGLIGYATLGLFLSDTAEEKLGYTPTEEDKKRLREAMPRIRVVDE